MYDEGELDDDETDLGSSTSGSETDLLRLERDKSAANANRVVSFLLTGDQGIAEVSAHLLGYESQTRLQMGGNSRGRESQLGGKGGMRRVMVNESPQ